MKRYSYSQLNKKVFILILSFSVVILLGFFILFSSIHKETNNYLKKVSIDTYKDILIKENYSLKNFICYSFSNADTIAKNELKKHVNDAYSIVRSIYIQNKKAGLPDSVIKTSVRETLRKLKFRNGLEYYFIQNINGTVEMNSQFPQLEGKNVLKLKDKKGKFFIKKVIKTALSKGEGFVEYYWKYKDSKELKKKICFIKIFRPYNWIIGMSIFYETFYNTLKDDILAKLSSIVLPKNVSLVILNSDNSIIFKENLKCHIKLNYNSLKNNKFQTITYNNQKHLCYTTQLEKVNWKIVSFMHYKDLQKIINKSNIYFSKVLNKTFIVFFIMLFLFLCFVVYYFSKINKKFTNNFKLLHDDIVKASKGEKISIKNYEFEELYIIAENFIKIINEIKREKNITEIIAENIDIGIIFLSPEMKIEYINSSGLEILGYKKNEVLRKIIRDVVKGVDINTLEPVKPENCEIRRLFTGKRYAKKRVYYTKKDGSIVPVEVTYIALKSKNKVEKIIVAFKDISEQLKWEKEILEAKRIAEEATEAKSKFLANMSHEIRTPMNAVIGFADLLLESENLTEEQKNYLNIIKESSNNLINIINDILDLSKLERKKIEYEARNFSLKEMIIECVNIFRFKAKEKEIELNYNIDEKIPEMIKGDKYRISQVINNLISNALKFTSEGSIDVNAELVEIKDDKAKIKFSVTDTGIGIEEDKLEKIFKAFSQADSSTTRKFGGTGLGLTICKNIVEQLGGKLEVKSEVGKGAEFFFTLEFLIGDEIIEYEIYEDKREINLNNLKVLIVEDDIFNQKFLFEMLKKAGITDLIVANNGKEAIEILSVKDFDIVLMDIEMPEMNGIEAVKIIRKLENDEIVEGFAHIERLKGRKIKIIALTGHEDDEKKREILDAGFTDYISKPIDIKTLIEKIRKLCEKDKSYNIVNYNELKELVGDDEELIQSLISHFTESLNKDIKDLEIAINEENFDEIYKIAHKIKGSAGNIKAHYIANIAIGIETSAKNKNLNDVKKLYEELKKLNNS